MSYQLPPGVGPPAGSVVPYRNPHEYQGTTLTLKSVDEITTQHGVKVLVYGRPGLGKTRLIATCPNPVIFSAERGLLSLRGSNLSAFEIKDVSDLERAHNWALSSPEAKRFDTICLDSISEIAEVCLIAEKAKGGKNGFAAYGALNERILQIFRDFRDHAHKHVYFVCKEEMDKDETGMMKYQPSMPGRQLAQQIAYLFDEIFRYEIYVDPTTKTETRYLRTKPDNTSIAKDRSGRLEWAEPADLGAIFAKILA